MNYSAYLCFCQGFFDLLTTISLHGYYFFEKKKEIIFIIEDEYGIVEKVEKINVSSNEPKEFEVLF